MSRAIVSTALLALIGGVAAGSTPTIATRGGDILLSPADGGSVRVLDTATGETPSLAESLSGIERRAEKLAECAGDDREGIAEDVKLLAVTLADVVDGLKASLGGAAGPVAALGFKVNGVRVIGPNSPPSNRLARVYGMGFEQFFDNNGDNDDLFACSYTFGPDKLYSDRTGISCTGCKGSEDLRVPSYFIQCNIPTLDSVYDGKAVDGQVDLWYYGNDAPTPVKVDFKGSATGNILGLLEGVTSAAVVPVAGKNHVVVTGVGLDRESTYKCIFVVPADGDSAYAGNTAAPTSTERLDCGVPPKLAGAGVETPDIQVSVTLARDGKNLPFVGDTTDATFAYVLDGDGHANGFETDVDCGGDFAGKCGVQLRCKKDSDCENDTCVDNKCGFPESCKAWGLGLPNGVYNISSPTDPTKAAAVYCDMTSGGWHGAKAGTTGYPAGPHVKSSMSTWARVSTCGKSWGVGPRPAECATWYRNPRNNDASTISFYDGLLEQRKGCYNAREGPHGIRDVVDCDTTFQVFTAPANGELDVKLWGASGMMCTWESQTSTLSRGGFAEATFDIEKGEQFIFMIGQKGRPGTNRAGGFGGGGSSITTGGAGGTSGSGGTHLFFWPKGKAGLPSMMPASAGNDYRILVAGGAGGGSTEDCSSGYSTRNAGHGGGREGSEASNTPWCTRPAAGSQTSGGDIRCGAGGNSPGGRFWGGRGDYNDAGGGGGGYFGGGGGGTNTAGSGGSGYDGVAGNAGSLLKKPKSVNLVTGGNIAPKNSPFSGRSARMGGFDDYYDKELVMDGKNGEGFALFRFKAH